MHSKWNSPCKKRRLHPMTCQYEHLTLTKAYAPWSLSLYYLSIWWKYDCNLCYKCLCLLPPPFFHINTTWCAMNGGLFCLHNDGLNWISRRVWMGRPQRVRPLHLPCFQIKTPQCNQQAPWKALEHWKVCNLDGHKKTVSVSCVCVPAIGDPVLGSTFACHLSRLHSLWSALGLVSCKGPSPRMSMSP